MIKDLINDLAFDKIDLSQGLTRAKIIAFKVDSKLFQEWIKKELEGYNNSDSALPNYRKIHCVVKGEIANSFGSRIIPFSFNGIDAQIKELVNLQMITQSISSLEENINVLESQSGISEFTPEQVVFLEETFKIGEVYGETLIRAGREVNRLELINIINQTKQKLIDTLLQLDKEFPNLENDYKMNKEDNNKVNNIITNNIYGDNNPFNVMAGTAIKQNEMKTSVINNEIDYSILAELGIDATQIDEIKQIIQSNKNDKISLKNTVMNWLGRVTSSLAAKGLYENIPKITDFVSNLI